MFEWIVVRLGEELLRNCSFLLNRRTANGDLSPITIELARYYYALLFREWSNLKNNPLPGGHKREPILELQNKV